MNPEITDTESAPPNAPVTANPWLVSLTALLVGTATVLALFRYNYQYNVVWAIGKTGPFRSWDEFLLINIVGLVFLPFLLILGVFRENASEFGFRPAEKEGTRFAWIFLAVMLPCILVASRFSDFRHYYPIQAQAAYDLRYLIYFEVSYGFYLFCWEYFYRGFLTFGLARRFGFPAAIVLQAVAFGALHYGKPPMEFAGSFVAGIALGWLAWKARSFLPGFLLHWFIAVSFDLLAIHARAGGLF